MTKKTPLELLNQQLEASGMEPIEPPPAAAVIETIDPVYRELTQQFQSHNRAGRALQSLGTFKPELVPNGYGEAIASSSAKHGIPPGVLAGLLATESNFDPSAKNPSGATGIAQIIPKWHPEHKVGDPVADIDYAASYLRRIMDGENYTGQPVDIEMALMMYNAGPFGGVYPNGTENDNYRKFVFQHATRFGDRSAYEQGTLVRPGVLPLWQQRTSEIG